jgi:hypothetical protein
VTVTVSSKKDMCVKGGVVFYALYSTSHPFRTKNDDLYNRRCFSLNIKPPKVPKQYDRKVSKDCLRTDAGLT